MADEVRLVDRHVLQRDDALAGYDLQHAVDHHEWIAVRQRLQYLLDIHQLIFRV